MDLGTMGLDGTVVFFVRGTERYMGLSGNDCKSTIYAVAHPDLPPYIVGFPHYPTVPCPGATSRWNLPCSIMTK